MLNNKKSIYNKKLTHYISYLITHKIDNDFTFHLKNCIESINKDQINFNENFKTFRDNINKSFSEKDSSLIEGINDSFPDNLITFEEFHSIINT